GGLTWSLIHIDTISDHNQVGAVNALQHVWRIVLNPKATTDHTEIYAATADAIWRSTNDGRTWSLCLGDRDHDDHPDIVITPTGILYATLGGSTGGVWRSTNGVDWVNVAPSDWTDVYARMCIAVSPSNENILY